MRPLAAILLTFALTSAVNAQVYVAHYGGPVVVQRAAPVFYAPVAPRPTTVFYAQPPMVVAPGPVAVTRTRRRLLGGSITRVRYYDAPVTFAAPVPVTTHYFPGW